MMKKFGTRLFLMTIALVGLVVTTACGGDDDDDPASDIVGKWTLVKTVDIQKVNGQIVDLDDEEDDDDYDDEIIGPNVWDFQKNGTLVVTYEDEPSEYGKWSLSGNKLTTTIVEDGETITSTSTVKTLTKAKMVISASYKFESPIGTVEYIEEGHFVRL